MRAKDRPLANDFVPDAEFDRLLKAWFGNLARVLLPGRAFYLWGGYANVGNYPPVLKEVGLYYSQAIIWDKQHPVLTRKDYMGAHEWCFYGWREGAAHQFFGPNNATDLWSVKKVSPQAMIHLCFHPDALVLTESGYRPIRAVRAGDRVFSGDGRFHDVTHASSHPYTSECLYRISAKGGNVTTDTSDNHPFLIWRPTRRRAAFVGGEVGWVRGDEVRIGDYTMTPILAGDGPDPFPEVDEDYWFLFGLYLAQGHLQRAGHGDRRYPVFSIHKRRQGLGRAHLQVVAERTRIRPQRLRADAIQRPEGDGVRRGRRRAVRDAGRAGCRRQASRPGGLYTAAHKRSAVLHGWLNGDGCKVHDRAYWQGNTVSADLAAHLCLLAESVGYRANLYTYDPPADPGGIGERRFQSRRRVYYLYFYEGGQLARRGCPTRMEHDGREYSLRYVKRVEPIRYEGEVWNLSVDGCPADRPVDDQRARQPAGPQRRHEGRRLPVPVRDRADQPLADRRPPVAPRHVGSGPRLVDEDQPLRIKGRLGGPPLPALRGHVRTDLLGGPRHFFFTVRPRAATARHRVDRATASPRQCAAGPGWRPAIGEPPRAAGRRRRPSSAGGRCGPAPGRQPRSRAAVA